MSDEHIRRACIPYGAPEDIHPVALAIWDSLIGFSHDGSEELDGFYMRNNTKPLRDQVYKMAGAAVLALTR